MQIAKSKAKDEAPEISAPHPVPSPVFLCSHRRNGISHPGGQGCQVPFIRLHFPMAGESLTPFLRLNTKYSESRPWLPKKRKFRYSVPAEVQAPTLC